MTVGQIIASKGRSVVTVKPEFTLHDVVRVLRDKRIGAVVVSADGSRIDGILSERDLVHLLAERGAAVLAEPVASVMIRTVVTCRDGDSIMAVLTEMTNRRFRHLPVADDDGRLAGMISIGDAVKARLDEVTFEAESLREYIVMG
jgi:CBS domain-containing protein